MAHVIEADENGALVIPPDVNGRVPPGARFIVEPQGDVMILRRERSSAEEWWSQTTPTERVARLKQWVANLPESPALPEEATHRDSIYE